MKKDEPYNKSLGEKMEQLPMPDVQHNWQEMRRLLDQEMPRGGGYSKRRGGWWLFGSVLLLVITGSWLLTTMNPGRQNADPPVSKGVNISPPQSDEVAGNLSDPNQSEKPTKKDEETLHREKEQIINPENENPGSSDAGSDVALRTEKSDAEQLRTAKATKDPLTPSEIQRSDLSGRPEPNYKPDSKDELTSVITKAGRGRRVKSGGSVRRSDDEIPGDNNLVSPIQITSPQIAETEAGPDYAAVSDKIMLEEANSVAEKIDSTDLSKMLVLDYTPVSRKWRRENRKFANPPNVRSPYTTEGRTFAFGISLPLGFPLGDQKMLGYNVNAGPNTASDYIPVPHIQYHFSGKTYLQSEVQFMTPQFIKPVMLYKDYYTAQNYTMTNSVTARKLYYFNLPVSVHYSPFRHFYMGTGLQFSSLLSGVAMIEETKRSNINGQGYHNVSYKKFSNDSISRSLNSNEMRLMLDANYYWHKFTVGLRYNQALNNYVSTRVSPTMPYTLDKNKSLQFYMRFNLWEEKKRKSGKQLMTRK